jgi:hypothetical protein
MIAVCSAAKTQPPWIFSRVVTLCLRANTHITTANSFILSHPGKVHSVLASSEMNMRLLIHYYPLMYTEVHLLVHLVTGLFGDFSV